MKIRLKDIDSVQKLAAKFLSATAYKKVIAFYGSMGAGKTTFIKALCDELKTIDVATSPTFTIVNEYLTESGEDVFHFDFYRINALTEALDFGFEEYLESGSYCFIEWPEKIESLLPEDTLKVYIEVNEDQSRTLTF